MGRPIALVVITFVLSLCIPVMGVAQGEIDGFDHLGGFIYQRFGKVYYYQVGKCNGAKCLIPLRGADAETFEALENYARDKQFVYHSDIHGTRVLKGIDPGTFVELGHGLAKDKSHLLDRDRDITAFLASGLELSSFEMLSPFLGKDARKVYVIDRYYPDSQVKAIKSLSSNPALFRVFPGNFAADHEYAYYRDPGDQQFHRLGVPPIDGPSFEIVVRDPTLIVKDKQRVYEPSRCNFFHSSSPLRPVSGLDPAHVQLVGDESSMSYLVDNKRVFYLDVNAGCAWKEAKYITLEEVLKEKGSSSS